MAGIGLVPGTVGKFNDSSVSVPHMGWNSLRILKVTHTLARTRTHARTRARTDSRVRAPPCVYGEPRTTSPSSVCLDVYVEH